MNLCLVFLAIAATVSAGDDWSHKNEDNGLDHWPELYDSCGGSRQSGINIVLQDLVYKEELSDFEFLEVYSDTPVRIKNNGHTVALSASNKISVTEANLPGAYQIHSAHFHWGSHSVNGSEHQIDGKYLPLELHFVTYNSERYATLGEAIASSDGSALAVLGVQFQVSSSDNTDLNPLTDRLSSVINLNDETDLDPSFKLRTLLPPDTDKYYRYEGSLTTPPCSEVVIWSVMAHQLTVSEAQLEKFRALMDGHHNPISDNWRPVQPKNGRTVYKSFEKDDISDESGDNGSFSVNAFQNLFCSMTLLLVAFYLV